MADMEEIQAIGIGAIEDKTQEPLFTLMAEDAPSLYERFSSIFDRYTDACGLEVPEEIKAKRVTAKGIFYNIRLRARELNKSFDISRNDTAISNTRNSCDSRPKARLPMITLPEFSGERTEWTRFRDTFQSLVMSDSELSQTDKFHYLLASLKGTAKAVIADLPISDNNFPIAWKSLVDAFDHPRIIATAYLDRLLSIEPLKAKPTTEQLRMLTSKLSEWVAAFNQIDIKDKADFLMFYLVQRCLDLPTRQTFEFNQPHRRFPTCNDLLTFLRHRCTADELAAGCINPIVTPLNKLSRSSHYNHLSRPKPALLVAPPPSPKTPSRTAQFSHESSPITGSCPICRDSHQLIRCPKFSNMPAERRALALANSKWRGCRNCLFSSHETKHCISRTRCRVCQQRHHSLLHITSESKGSRSSLSLTSTIATQTERRRQPTAGPSTSALSAVTSRSGQVILGTALCRMLDNHGRAHEIRIALDSGSQFSFLTRHAATKLGLSIQRCNLDVIGIGQTPLLGFKGRARCRLLSTSLEREVSTTALVVDRITSDLPTSEIPEDARVPYLQYELADPHFWKPGAIDFLLGADLFAEILTGDIITLTPGQPKLLSTIFGYIIIGRTVAATEGTSIPALFTSSPRQVDSALLEDLSRLREIDEVTPIRTLNPEEEECEEYDARTHYRLPTGRYGVRLPFKTVKPDFPSSRWLAMKRLTNIEAKLGRNPDLAVLYRNFMAEYEQLGHMSLATTPGRCIIPHHCVNKLCAGKQKLRVVFDASVGTQNGSLNNHLHVGAKLQNKIINNTFWFHGPGWAILDPCHWPVSILQRHDELLPEMKSLPVLAATTQANTIMELIQSSSSYCKVIRLVATMKRFIHNCQAKAGARITSPLSPQELRASLHICCRVSQELGFANDTALSMKNLPKSLLALSPFLDEDGLLRVGGRIRRSSLPFSTKHPILLPGKSHLAQLIVDHYHRLLLHPGPTLMLSTIRRKFWIIGARNLVRQYCRQCVPCRRLNARPCQPIMADLPAERLTEGRAFLQVGVDFAGPFIVRDSLRRKAPQSKCYLCLFVCLSSRAVHLEAVSAISSPAFIAAFDRFISRRGLPECIFSDNGTNFIGAANQLKEWYDWYHMENTQRVLNNYASLLGIEWKFIPPHAPHFGGLWEAGVRSAKKHLRYCYGEGVFTYEEIATLFARIEAIMNSRPICPLSTDLEDIDALTPGHLLIGQALLSPPEPSYQHIKETRLDRWELVRQRVQFFWKRWKAECLHELQTRTKWRHPQPNLAVGDLVFVLGEVTPPQRWPLGRIKETYPGSDGVVRVALVQTKRNTVKRPVTKLVPVFAVEASSDPPSPPPISG